MIEETKRVNCHVCKATLINEYTDCLITDFINNDHIGDITYSVAKRIQNELNFETVIYIDSPVNNKAIDHCDNKNHCAIKTKDVNNAKL
jgi:hypothetical protein